MYIFVYGTLRKYGTHHALLEKEELKASQAWTLGTIYDSGKGYPYFINEGKKRVYGELYDVSENTHDKIRNMLSLRKEKFSEAALSVYTDHLGSVTAAAFVQTKEITDGLSPLTYGDWIVHLELDREEHYYFAYGSCMDNARFKLAQVDHLFADRIGGGVVDRLEMNYSLSVEDGGRANLIETGNSGEGVVYRVGKEAVDYLFLREGVEIGHYRPAFVDLKVKDKVYEKCMTFIVNDPVEESAPPLHYATEIIRGSYGVVSDSYHEKMIKDLKEKFNLTLSEDG
ncbi:gamma-glutamylcyclotransferase [Jeotgalibacillus proteolyticus]|uniref:Gamma-glutamylcyclotransferase n=1 Tax=Jeotgalibacillus proteolyticus TaxID=2082395 RepID=A0A2S5GFT2_9BACL|nr:gamma-glutamylcyclotransferase [Jeotgalibacillus proteolyticus]PPA71887.1 gamma-glutamylcyclotransferase [Jeotgalibacillus proteolyticus]